MFNESFDLDQFGLDTIEYVVQLDAGNISTFSGDFSAFRERGGKLITYHGRSDDVRIPVTTLVNLHCSLAL